MFRPGAGRRAFDLSPDSADSSGSALRHPSAAEADRSGDAERPGDRPQDDQLPRLDGAQVRAIGAGPARCRGGLGDRIGRASGSARSPAEAGWVGGGTYSNGRGERSQADPGDLNVPLALSCELIGAGRWSQATAG